MAIVLNGTTGITTPNVASDTSTLGPLTQALNLGSTGQIVFPATQNASANANTLDDYEEGTWTPTLGGFSSVTYDYREGSYIKIGRMVFAFWDFISSSKSGTGNSQITGLPFTVSPSMAGYSVVQHRSADLFNANGVTYGQIKGFVERSATYIALQVDFSTTASFGTASSTIGYNSSGRSTGYVIYEAAS